MSPQEELCNGSSGIFHCVFLRMTHCGPRGKDESGFMSAGGKGWLSLPGSLLIESWVNVSSWFVETRTHCVALAGLELTMQSNPALIVGSLLYTPEAQEDSVLK